MSIQHSMPVRMPKHMYARELTGRKCARANSAGSSTPLLKAFGSGHHGAGETVLGFNVVCQLVLPSRQKRKGSLP